MKLPNILLCLSALFLGAVVADPPSLRGSDHELDDHEGWIRRLDAGDPIPGSYIVRFNDNVEDVRGLIQAMRAKNSNIGPPALVFEKSIKGFAARGISVALARQLSEIEGVVSVEQDQVVAIDAPPPGKGAGNGGEDGDGSPTGPPQVTPYGIERVNGPIDCTVDCGKAWVIDSGIDIDHPDLNVDTVIGFTAFTKGKDANFDDRNGHGTHVAGTIAAIDNGIGVVGVAAGATVVPVKVLDSRGSGSFSGVIAGIEHVAKNGKTGDVANMSLGGGYSSTLNYAVEKAAEDGIKFVLAAGNSGADASTYSPASAEGEHVYTISAVDSNDVFASFSNYGPPVDFAAPGVSIYSTYIGGGYATLSGTSMAAPHAAGVLLLCQDRYATDGAAIDDPDGNNDPIIVLPNEE
jgi:subtilisin family serine protease